MQITFPFPKSKWFVAKFVDDIFAKSKLHTDRKAHKGNQWTNTALDWKTFKTISIKAQFSTTSAGNYCFPKLKWTMRPPQFESLHHMCFQSRYQCLAERVTFMFKISMFHAINLIFTFCMILNWTDFSPRCKIYFRHRVIKWMPKQAAASGYITNHIIWT